MHLSLSLASLAWAYLVASTHELYRRDDQGLGDQSPLRYLASEKMSVAAAGPILTKDSFDQVTEGVETLTTNSIFTDAGKIFQSFIDKLNDYNTETSKKNLLSFIDKAEDTFKTVFSRQPNYFALCGFQGVASDWCLTTRDGTLKSRHNLLFTNKHANLDTDVHHMTFTEVKGELIFLMPNGINKCLSYDANRGNSRKGYLAIFDSYSFECNRNAGKYKFRLKKADDGYKLIDYNVETPKVDGTPLCVGDGRGYDERVLLNSVSNNKKKDDCLNNGNLTIEHKLLIPFNRLGQRIPFDQMDKFLTDMTLIASSHLVALKELFYYTQSKKDSEKFSNVVIFYQQFLGPYIQSYNGYLAVKGLEKPEDYLQVENFVLNELSFAQVNLELGSKETLSSTVTSSTTSTRPEASSTPFPFVF